ncbi:MAG: hypothetical protein QHC79_18850 [Pseudosphingobacterium sp.]|nr:hypothetical protein [Pseudosphingobacterium sp.]
MKNAIKIIVALTLSIATMGTLRAQSRVEKAVSAGGIEKATLFMKKKYGLNAEQYQSVLEINKSFAEKVKPILLNDQSKMEKLVAIKPLARERENALMAIFNQEQFGTFKKLKEERSALLKAWLDE